MNKNINLVWTIIIVKKVLLFLLLESVFYKLIALISDCWGCERGPCDVRIRWRLVSSATRCYRQGYRKERKKHSSNFFCFLKEKGWVMKFTKIFVTQFFRKSSTSPGWFEWRSKVTKIVSSPARTELFLSCLSGQLIALEMRASCWNIIWSIWRYTCWWKHFI